MIRPVVRVLALGLLLSACTLGRSESQIVLVTATPPSSNGDSVGVSASPVPRVDLSPVPDALVFLPTDNPSRSVQNLSGSRTHTVVSGDTLFGIALSYGITLEALLGNNDLTNPDALYIGQVINLPEMPTQMTPSFKVMPDSRVVRGPGSSEFDVISFVAAQPGYIRMASDIVETRQADGRASQERLNAGQIVDRVALEFSVDPRLLLALLEYRAGWLSDPDPPAEQRDYPLISEADSGDIDRKGLYRQLAWAADRLNHGYYGWKYGNGTQVVSLADDRRLLVSPGLNPGTVAVQYFLSLNRPMESWSADVTKDGFFSTYWRYFGDPFQVAYDPLVPSSLTQPEMVLPFSSGETWYFTGGWHGGWGNGSAWAALDFAPPDDPNVMGGIACYTSDYMIHAVAPGVIARSGQGVVVLDLDGDMDEATGWTVLYLHVASAGRIPAGSKVETGDPIGRASCEGGFSTATHLHIARRFNGEWIPADCQFCPPGIQSPAFKMGQWSAVGLESQVYQGFLRSDQGSQRIAEQGRSNPNNQISW